MPKFHVVPARRVARFAVYATARVIVVTQSYRIEPAKANTNAREVSHISSGGQKLPRSSLPCKTRYCRFHVLHSSDMQYNEAACSGYCCDGINHLRLSPAVVGKTSFCILLLTHLFDDQVARQLSNGIASGREVREPVKAIVDTWEGTKYSLDLHNPRLFDQGY